MNINTIVTDMDGMLPTPERVISPYTMEMLRECMRRGIRVIPCSGRTPASMRPYLKQLNTGTPYISGNGSAIIGADHRILQELTLEVDLAREIVAFFKQADFYVQVFGSDAFYYESECAQSERYRLASGMKGVPVGDLERFITEPTPKISAVGTPDEVNRFYPIISRHFEGRAVFTISEPEFFGAGPIGASKGEALRRLAALRGDIVPERTIAFGDSLNDLSLLTFTPNSVAMGNAREEIKAHAAHVCESNAQDGLARFVERHIL